VDQTLTERYAAPPRWRRAVTIAVVAVVALAGLAWVGWAAYDEATPKVESQLVTFHVGGEHSVEAQIDVRLSSGTTGASCTVQALADDHSIVGELHFRPVDGANQVTVRTDRVATSVDLSGCIANGQDRPR
jgi:hypothetical protein